jgi:hypothetical protein
MWRFGSTLPPSLVVLLTLLLIFRAVVATNVKWTAASSDPTDRAAKAPKSQKYWDEHGIERPDYAKTDAEVAAEQGVYPNFFLLVILAMAALAIGINLWSKTRGGTRLEGGSNVFKRQLTEDEARRARLARFEQQQYDKKD